MFRFKEFTIHQDKCAMKVCTDACLFGAWVADKIKTGEIDPTRILDIGSGTGFLSLMVAQSSDAKIDGVEIEEDAFRQSSENINNSKWRDKITLHHTPIGRFSAGTKYDLVISNPPFYEDQLRSPDGKKNIAMHTAMLSFEELISAVKYNLSDNGFAAILIPFERSATLEKLAAQKGLLIAEKLNVSHSPTHAFFRSFLLFSFTKVPSIETGMTIKDSTGGYSMEFVSLLKDYYMAF